MSAKTEDKKMIYKDRTEAICNAVPILMEDLSTIIKDRYNNKAMRTGHAMLVIGESGIGKTQIMQSIADDLDIELVYENLANKEKEDIVGFPMAKDNSYNFVLPEYNSRIYEPGFKAILLLDELAQSLAEVIRATFPIIQERRNGDRTVSDGVLIIATMNPTHESDYMLSKLDKATQERFDMFHAIQTMPGWLKFARTQGWNDSILSCIADKGEIYEKNNPRRLHKLCDIADLYTGKDLTDQKIMKQFTLNVQSVVHTEDVSTIIKYMNNIIDISGNSVLTGEGQTFSKLSKMMGTTHKSTGIYRIQNDIARALENPEIIEGFMTTSNNKIIKKGVEKAARNIVRYCSLLQKEDMDKATALMRVVFSKSNDVIKKKLLNEITLCLNTEPKYKDLQVSYRKAVGFAVGDEDGEDMVVKEEEENAS